MTTLRCHRPRRPRPRAYLPRTRDLLAYLERTFLPRAFDTFLPRLRAARALDLLRFAEALDRDFERDFAFTGSIGTRDRTKARLMRAASFLSRIGFSNSILYFFPVSYMAYSMRVLLVTLCDPFRNAPTEEGVILCLEPAKTGSLIVVNRGLPTRSTKCRSNDSIGPTRGLQLNSLGQ